ncbi:MAG: 50S ribosomal protein L11 methyltransferase [Sphingomicrobium sp.]
MLLKVGTARMYSAADYGRMIADRARVAAYTEALRRAVRPGCVVLDIGTGTGFFAMLACRLGARKVYAIEPDNVILLAREAARTNGYADRIEFIQDLSTRVELPERVDVIVSDLRSVLPWFQQHIASIIDARERLLAPGGVLIPERDTLWAAVVEMPEVYADHVAHQPEDTWGFDMSAARRSGANVHTKARAKPEQLLTEPRQWATLHYSAVKVSNVDAQINWTVARSGTAHGFVAWFDTILTEDVGFSNAPGGEPLLYGNAFFPWQEPVAVVRGDAIEVSLRANLVGDDYIWRWDSRVTGSAGTAEPKAEFSQSNFLGPQALERLRRGAASYVPVLNGREEVDRFIIDHFDGKRSLRDIAEAVASHFPDQFPSWEVALGAVGELSFRYTR